MKLMILLGLLLAEPTYSVEETIGQCAQLPTDSDRLACFDELATLVAKDTETQTAAAAQPNQTSTPSSQEAENEPRYVILRSDDPKLKESKDSGFLSGFFDREEYQATIRAVKRNNVGILFMELDNGEIWRENRPALRHDPVKGETVILRPAATGGWFAVFPTADRRTKMRRTKLGK